MGRRTIRLRDTQLQPDALAAHLGRVVDVVLTSGATHHGILREASATHLVLEDLNRMWYNDRKHMHRISLGEVQELTVAPWQGY
jgi:hypothetical protein